MTTITKKTTLIPRPVIAQTADGKCKVYSLKDPASPDRLVFGNTWHGESEGLFTSYVGTQWSVVDAKLFPGGGIPIPTDVTVTAAADGKSFTVARKDGVEDPPTGVYPDAHLSLNLIDDTGTTSLSIPCKVTVSV